MMEKASSIRRSLKPQKEVKVRLQNKKKIKEPKIPPRKDPIPIFWKDRDIEQGLLERFRSFFWFLPDRIFRLIHKTRPFSYMIFYGVLTFLSWQAVSYAANSPESLFNYEANQNLQEAAVGRADSINPLFITHNQIERDIQELVFNSLIEIGPDGIPKKELAESWAISNDGKTYTFFLKNDIYWQDGERLTAEDVVFTFETIQNLKDEDSFYTAFKDVEIGKLDDFSVIFTLPQRNSTFLENLTVGIVPKHLLDGIRPVDLRSTVFNQFPVGTGPFQIIRRNDDHILLARHVNYFKGTPKLETVHYTFYQDEDALVNDIKQFKHHTFTNPSPENIRQLNKYKVYPVKSFVIHLRDKMIFFNLRNEKSPLADENVRRALSLATDKKTLIEEIDTGGEIAYGPISKYSWAFNKSLDRYDFDPEKAGKLFAEAGWEYSKQNGEIASVYRKKDGKNLTIKLSLLDTPINDKIAAELKRQWKLAGIELVVDTQKYEKIASETISRRDFEALLFEVETTPDPDKYNFWHSLRAEYPGLNLSGYSYQRVDILLEQGRRETKREERKEHYDLMQKYVLQDMPALFLYHPTYEFIAHKSVKGIELENVSLPHQRYNNVHEWYIQKD